MLLNLVDKLSGTIIIVEDSYCTITTLIDVLTHVLYRANRPRNLNVDMGVVTKR